MYDGVIGMTFEILIMHHFSFWPCILCLICVHICILAESPKYTHLKIQKCGNYEYLAKILLSFLWTKVFNGYLFTKFLSVFVKFTFKEQDFCSYNEKKIIRQSKWKFPKFIFSKISDFHRSESDLRLYFITKVID